MTVNMRNYRIDEKNKILNIDLQCESGKDKIFTGIRGLLRKKIFSGIGTTSAGD